jgi:hypothetical protein
MFTQAMIDAAAHLPPAGERAVSAEVRRMLRNAHCAQRLGDFEPGTVIVPGVLVYVMSEFINRPLGIDPGDADLKLRRVGRWPGWLTIELKKRGKNGMCAGSVSAEQWTAFASGLYPLAWCAQHVRESIGRMDRYVAWAERETLQQEPEAQARNG